MRPIPALGMMVYSRLVRNLQLLPEPLRTKVKEKVRRTPKARPHLEVIMKRYAEAETDAKRTSMARLLDKATSSSKGGGWLGLALCTVIASLVGYAVYSDYRIERAAAEGVPTTARVERMEPGDCLITDKTTRCLRLTVRLHPAAGAVYTAAFTQSIGLEWMSRVQPGSWLTVAVDRADPQRVVLDVRTLQSAPPAPVTP